MTTTPAKITIVEAARILDLSTKSVRRYIAEGRITAYRVGSRLIRIDPAELADLLRPIPTARRAA